MKSISLNLSAWLRPVRLLLTACICALLLFSQALPASAAKSSPTGGEANLTKIEKKAQEAVLSDPYSLEKQQAETNPGLNEIQGTADVNEMKRPDNTRQGVESVEEKVQEALEKAEGKVKDLAP